MSDDYRAKMSDYEYYKNEIRCLTGCPVYTDAHGYVVAVSKGEFEKGYAIAREPNPFASICGRVCAAPCETACRKGEVADPVSIRAIKGFLTARHGVESENLKTINRVLSGENELGLQGEFDIRTLKDFCGTTGSLDSEIENSGKKVAIIGSGCAGMTAAHDLAVLGYQVTVYEAESKAGGMLSQGVPRFRLSRKIVEAEINSILQMGVKLKLNSRIGKDITIDGLFDLGFESVLIAAGLQNARMLDIKGSDLNGILPGIDFLREKNLRTMPEVGKKVVVIGGGDVAMDCARVSLRGKAESVTVICLEDWDSMRASLYEREEAKAEGVEIISGVGPQLITGIDGSVTGIEIKEVKSLFDSERRFNPSYKEGTDRILEADTIIPAIGQLSRLDFLSDDTIKLTPGRTVAVETERLTTSKRGVFACGDIATGPKLFIDAVQQGHMAARSIHTFLSGEDIIVNRQGTMEEVASFYTVDRTDFLIKQPDTTDVAARITDDRMVEVEKVFEDEEAVIQGKRCLVCSINVIMSGEKCIACNGCVDVCPERCLRLVNLENLEGDNEVTELIGSVFHIPRENVILGSHYPVELVEGMAMLFDNTKCIRCGLCYHYCPTFAITMEKFSYKETFTKISKSDIS